MSRNLFSATPFLLVLTQAFFLLTPQLVWANAWDAFDPKVNPFPPTAQFAELFQVDEAKLVANEDEEPFTSFLFVPKDLDASKKYPLIIWLHGLGEVELDQPFGALNWLSQLIFTEPNRIEEYQFFVLAPRCKDRRGWIGTGYLPGGSTDSDSQGVGPAAAEYFLQRAIDEHPIDLDRISLVGISAGAAAACHWAFQSPDRFSAVALMAGGHMPPQTTGPSHAVFWQFVNRDDEDYKLENGLAFVAAANTLGSEAYLTVFPTGGHNVWNRAFLGRYKLLQWLFTTSRTDPPSVNAPSGLYTRRIMKDDLPIYRPPVDPWSVQFRRFFRAFDNNIPSIAGGLLLLGIILLCRQVLYNAAQKDNTPKDG